MRLWQRLWLLFAVIWVVLASLNVGTILVFAEGAEQDKFVWPLVLGVAVPAASYLFLWAWNKWLAKK
jgi:hypothetical protein